MRIMRTLWLQGDFLLSGLLACLCGVCRSDGVDRRTVKRHFGNVVYAQHNRIVRDLDNRSVQTADRYDFIVLFFKEFNMFVRVFFASFAADG